MLLSSTYRRFNIHPTIDAIGRTLHFRTIALMFLFVLSAMSEKGHSLNSNRDALLRPSTSAEKKACYVYNLAKLIDWPGTYRTGAFVIGYIGEESGYHQFSSYLNKKTIGSQRVYTTHIESIESLPACHVLFVDNNNTSVVQNVADQLPNPNTLLISHCPSGLEHGATINLVNQDSLLRFELSEENAKRHQLFIGSTLRGLAINPEE